MIVFTYKHSTNGDDIPIEKVRFVILQFVIPLPINLRDTNSKLTIYTSFYDTWMTKRKLQLQFVTQTIGQT